MPEIQTEASARSHTNGHSHLLADLCRPHRVPLASVPERAKVVNLGAGPAGVGAAFVPNGKPTQTFSAILERGLGRTVGREFCFPYARKRGGVSQDDLAPSAAKLFAKFFRRCPVSSLRWPASFFIRAADNQKSKGNP
jgi:hypothetical protein